ncbi:MAG: hypothetical protein WA971_13270, partial [Microbacterium sp.]
MASSPHRTDAVGWLLAAFLVAAACCAAIVLGAHHGTDEFPSAELTQSPVWLLVMIPSMTAALAIMVWTAHRGDTRLALWMLACVFSVAVYWLAPAVGGSLVAAGATGTVTFAAAVVVGSAGWTVVLALQQLTALTAAATVTGRVAPGTTRLAVVLALLPTLVTMLFPFPKALVVYPGLTTLFPADVSQHPLPQAIATAVPYAWMASLLIAPTVLWTKALRAHGMQRRALVRFAIGAMLPALVVALCGLLAELDRAGGSAEVDGLAVGFSLALPMTLGWLAATVRDARAASARFTSIAAVVRILLWLLYVFLMVQFITPLAAVLGGGASAGA